MVAFFAIFMIVMTFNLIIFPACALDTMETYGISQSGLTTLSSVTSFVGFLSGLVFGRMLDRFGSRRVIMIAMIFGIVLFYIRAFTTSYALCLVLTFLASFFVGVCQVAASKVLDTWFTKDKVTIAYSIQTCCAAIGSASAFAIGSFLGLHRSLLAIAICYTGIWVLWVCAGKEGPIAVQKEELPKGGMKKVYTSSYVWFLSIGYACAVGATLLINTYCVNAFISKGLSETGATMMGTVINLSLLVGGFLGTFIMGVVKRYNLCTIIFFGGGIAGFLLAWFTPLGINTWIFMVAGAVIMGNDIAVCAGRIPLIPLTGQFPQEYVGTASGAGETIKGLITFVFPIIIASVFETRFNAIFITFAIVCFIGIVTGGLLMPELGPKGKIQQEYAAKQAEQSGQSAEAQE